MCTEQQHLSAFLDNELAPRHAQQIESHVRDCPGCLADVRAYQVVSRTLLESREPDVNAAHGLIWRRLELVRAAVVRQASFWSGVVRVPAPLAAAAVAAIALLATSAALWARLGDGRSELGTLTSNYSVVQLEPTFAGLGPLAVRNERTIAFELPAESQLLPFGSPAILLEAELQGSDR